MHPTTSSNNLRIPSLSLTTHENLYTGPDPT